MKTYDSAPMSPILRATLKAIVGFVFLRACPSIRDIVGIHGLLSGQIDCGHISNPPISPHDNLRWWVMAASIGVWVFIDKTCFEFEMQSWWFVAFDLFGMDKVRVMGWWRNGMEAESMFRGERIIDQIVVTC